MAYFLKKHFKKIIIIFVSLGAVGGILFLTDKSFSITISPKNNLSKISINKNAENRLSFSNKNSPNLIKIVSNTLTKEIEEKNKGNLSQKNGKISIQSPSITSFMSELNKKIGSLKKYQNNYPPVDESKIIISYDISPNNQISYIKRLADISKKDFGNFHKTSDQVLNDLEHKNISSAKKLAEIYAKIINDIYQTPVPKNWLEFHKEYLTYFNICYYTYQSLANFQNDALLASVNLENVFAIKKLNYLLKLYLIKEIKKNKLKL